MKFVPNMIYSREMKFSFQVRASWLVPVTGYFSITLIITDLCIFRYTGTTGWTPQGFQARTELTAHIVHLLVPHRYYCIQQRKEILFLLFQSSYCHREAENQQWSDDKLKQNQFFAVYVAQTLMTQEKVSACCCYSKAKVPTTQTFWLSDVSEWGTKYSHDPKYTPCTVCIE